MKEDAEIFYPIAHQHDVDFGIAERIVSFIAMKEPRIDTLEHLLKQFRVNQKKLSPTACIGLVEELIKDIKK